MHPKTSFKYMFYEINISKKCNPQSKALRTTFIITIISKNDELQIDFEPFLSQKVA